MIIRRSYVYKPMVKFSGGGGGIPKKFFFANFLKYWWFQTNQFTRNSFRITFKSPNLTLKVSFKICFVWGRRWEHPPPPPPPPPPKDPHLSAHIPCQPALVYPHFIIPPLPKQNPGYTAGQWHHTYNPCQFVANSVLVLLFFFKQERSVIEQL